MSCLCAFGWACSFLAPLAPGSAHHPHLSAISSTPLPVCTPASHQLLQLAVYLPQALNHSSPDCCFTVAHVSYSLSCFSVSQSLHSPARLLVCLHRHSLVHIQLHTCSAATECLSILCPHPNPVNN